MPSFGLGCCGCCAALRPRYKRLVDNIYPSSPNDGLVKNNLEKLTFYADKSPEKLDRIGEYLYQKVARDLARHRIGFVMVGVDAMDQILLACHAKNLFVESFLKVVQLLLESQDPEMQLLATQSFVKFANIQEDTPSYHRRYDFFVSKFSSLCHSAEQDAETQKKLRLAGLSGIKGVIRKTVSDDLQVDIWDEVHMDKIVPSLLYNMKSRSSIHRPPSAGNQMPRSPSFEAEECLRELMGRATFGHIRSVITPVLKHLDNHQLWNVRNGNEFSVFTFKVIMHSIQTQHSYAVIQILMAHLDEKSKLGTQDRYDSPPDIEETRVRIGIVNVLSNIVAIAAAESIGPSVLEIINSLLNHLRNSINFSQLYHPHEDEANEEKKFQDAVINTLGEFANNLPDFQKIEIMMFIIGKVPPPSSDVSPTDSQLQQILLKSLLKVSTKYRTRSMAHAFPSTFLTQLLSMSLTADASVRLTVQHIFHQLLDRHGNLPKIEKPVTLQEPQPLIIEKAHRQDLMFMKKHGQELLLHIYENVQQSNNTTENYNALFKTMVLICVEMSSEDVLSDLLRLTFALQDYAISSAANELSPENKANIHSIVAAFLHLTSHLTAVPALGAHIGQVIKNRFEKAPWMLPDGPPLVGRKKGSLSKSAESPVDEELLFSKPAVAEALRSSGHDSGRMLQPFVPRSLHNQAMKKSISDLNNISVEIDSASSSPGVPRKYPEEEITFESFRKILTEPLPAQQEERESRRLQVLSRYKFTPFHELIGKQHRRTNELQIRLNEIFSRIPHSNSYNSAIEALDQDPVTEPLTDDELEVASLKNRIEKDKEDEVDDERNDVENISKSKRSASQKRLFDQSEDDKDANPFKNICNIHINPQQLPLFALQFPDLFVC